MKRLAKVLTITALLAFAHAAQAQDTQHEDSDRARLNYGFSETGLDTVFMRNSASIRRLKGFFDNVRINPDVSVKKVVITSFASMEGDVISNRRFIAERNATARDLVKRLSGLPDSLITCIDGGIAWDHLRDSVDRSDMQYKEEVLYIIDNQPEETWKDGTLVDSRRKHLMDLHGGEPYRYMRARFFAHYRYSRIRIIYTGALDEQTCTEIEQNPVATDSTDNYGDGLYIEIERDTVQELQDSTTRPDTTAAAAVLPPADTLAVQDTVTAPDTAASASVQATAQTARTEEKLPILGVKTNALVLFAGVANAGVEARIGKHFSIDFPVIYSPYTIKNNYRLRALAFQPEFRFWFKGYTEGHFLGLTGNFAWFNIALSNNNRYQDSADRPLMGAGISYGYSWKILPSLSLEFTIGAGYANIHYDVFYNVENGIQYNSGVKNYWGLTKAGISVVYIININKQGR